MTFSYLVGDIGGTNARLRMYIVPEKGDEELLGQNEYRSGEFSTLSAVIIQFLVDEGIDIIPNSACFSVAGPVKDGEVNLTNLGWRLNEREMEMELKINSVTFLNDFAACAYGLNMLRKEELFEISNGKKPEPNGHKFIIGAGTGLGEAYIINNNGSQVVVPGEGSHADFAPRTKVEWDLLNYIKRTKNLTHVAVERVVSGPGLETMYWFFAETMHNLANPTVSDQIRNAKHPGAIISKLAIEKEDVLCEKTLRQFISSFGAETGNTALNVLPTGGIYIAGGIAPKIRDVIKEEFLINFYEKGRMRRILVDYPIYIVTNLSLGVLGARYIGRQKICDMSTSIKRTLSITDIKSMSCDAQLVSEQDKTSTFNENFPRPIVFGEPSHDFNQNPIEIKRRSSKIFKNNGNLIKNDKKGSEFSWEKDRLKTNIFFLFLGIGLSASLFAALSLLKDDK